MVSVLSEGTCALTSVPRVVCRVRADAASRPFFLLPGLNFQVSVVEFCVCLMSFTVTSFPLLSLLSHFYRKKCLKLVISSF